MKVKIVTALFDINRDVNGDGRKVEEYLKWFEKTLLLKCDFVIFTQEKFESFILNCRKNSEYKTDIIFQKLEEVPHFYKMDSIKSILQSEYYKSKISDPNRIECYLPEYNVIQYSKLGWLKIATETFMDFDYFFWMDAGCSRFFEDFDINKNWPNTNLLGSEKLIIQGNSNFLANFKDMNPDEYVWDNNCMVVGTLFGGKKDILNFLYENVYKIYDFYESKGCVNNEQIFLAIFAKIFPEKCEILIYQDWTHLPIFRILGRE